MLHDTLQALHESYVFIALVLVVIASRVLIATRQAVHSGDKPRFVFDKTKLPQWGKNASVVMGIFFVYTLLVSGKVLGAIGFCLIVLPFVMLVCLLGVYYAPLDSTGQAVARQDARKANRKNKT